MQEEIIDDTRPSHVEPHTYNERYYERNKNRLRAKAKAYYRKHKLRVKTASTRRYKMGMGKACEQRKKRYASDPDWAERVKAYNRERQRRIRAAKREERNNANKKQFT